MNKYTFNLMVVVIITEMSSTQFGLHLRSPSLSPEKKVCHRSATIQEAQSSVVYSSQRPQLSQTSPELMRILIQKLTQHFL